jgi:hypothetical protein
LHIGRVEARVANPITATTIQNSEFAEHSDQIAIVGLRHAKSVQSLVAGRDKNQTMVRSIVRMAVLEL